MSRLYPQLPLPACIDHSDRVRKAAIPEAAEAASASHPSAVFTATGGRRAAEEDLRQLRRGLLAAAEANGFPDAATDAQRASFDVRAAAFLHEKMALAPAEAGRGGVWAFICIVLAPDLVRWRFPGTGSGTPPERLLPGRRNTFQRLWWRAEILRSGTVDAYRLLSKLGEDEAVQIMERPTLAGCRPLSTTVAQELLAAAERAPHIPRRTLVREAQKRIMRLASFISFDTLEHDQLWEHVRRVFEQVESAFPDSDTSASAE